MRRASLPSLATGLTWAPPSRDAWFEFGRRAARIDRTARALFERCATQATVYDSNSYRLWQKVGQLRLDMGLKDSAREAFARARELRFWVSIPEAVK